MAVRPTVDLKFGLIKTYTVKAATVATAGLSCKFGATDTEVEVVTTDDQETAIGIFMESAVAGARVQVCLFCHAIAEVTVGTGGSTRGIRQKLVPSGVTDVTAATDRSIGVAMNSGVAADKIGLGLLSR
jgi:hypothetical protein